LGRVKLRRRRNPRGNPVLLKEETMAKKIEKKKVIYCEVKLDLYKLLERLSVKLDLPKNRVVKLALENLAIEALTKK